jgi:hypothetical protein
VLVDGRDHVAGALDDGVDVERRLLLGGRRVRPAGDDDRAEPRTTKSSSATVATAAPIVRPRRVPGVPMATDDPPAALAWR